MSVSDRRGGQSAYHKFTDKRVNQIYDPYLGANNRLGSSVLRALGCRGVGTGVEAREMPVFEVFDVKDSGG